MPYLSGNEEGVVDIVAAMQTARTKAAGLLNDQEISAIALLLSSFLADTLERPERPLEKTPYF